MATARIFCNGRFPTLHRPTRPPVALATYGGRIVCVGDRRECVEAIPAGVRYEEVDLNGAVVLPGFRDSHLHLLSLGINLSTLQLQGTSSIEELKRRVAAACAGAEPDEWVTGRGWDQNVFVEKRYPSRTDLDQAAGERPVYLVRTCGHVGVASSRALELAGITRDTPDPPGGTIDRDETGEPTGILREGAQSLVLRHVPRPGPDAFVRALKAAVAKALESGLTAVSTNDGQAGFHGTMRLYREVLGSSSPRLRVYWDVPWDFFEDVIDSGLRTGAGDEFFRIGAMKLLADGSLGARTAALEESYEDDPGNAGMLTMAEEELASKVYRAHVAGMQVAVHAIGDRALRVALTAISEAQSRIPSPWRRHRIVHAQVVSPELINGMRRNRVVVDVQPRFVNTDMYWAESRLGRRRARYSYAWKTLLRAGIPLAGGSDCPVEPLAPVLGIYAAVTRTDEGGRPDGGWYPEEKLTVGEAVDLFTRGAAFSAFQEEEAGSLEPGKFCDLTVLNEDPFVVDEEDLKNLKVVMTVVGGEIAFAGEI